MKRVLILTATTGSGHDSVARTLRAALMRQGRDEVGVRLADLAGEEGIPSLGRRGGLYAPIVVGCPAVWGVLYRLSDRPQHWRAFRSIVWRVWGRRLAAMLRLYRPDALLCVHPIWNHVAAEALRCTRYPAPLVTVVTDLGEAHAGWVAPGVTHYLAATEEVKAGLLSKGVPDRRIALTELPVDGRFGRVGWEKVAVHPSLGLRDDRPTVLLSGGGEGAGGMRQIAAAIGAAGLPIQVIGICGRNERLQRSMAGCSLPYPHRWLGFVDDMPTLMAASDIIVGKGGALTIGEAVMVGKPLAIINALPGQEAANAWFARRHGLARVCPDTPALVDVLRTWVARPGDREALVEQSAAYRRLWSEAADRIAGLVLESAGISSQAGPMELAGSAT